MSPSGDSTARDQSGAKHAWRQWMKRIHVPPTAEVNVQVASSVSEMLDVADGLVLTYFAMPGEIDLGTLLDRNDADRLVTTRTPPTGPLTVHPAAGPLERHRWGFEQPAASAPEVDPSLVEIALVPGVAFGRDGTRLGHGAGYYDRLLGSVAANAALVAITWSAITVESVPVEAHDIAMSHLANESGVTAVSTLV